MAQQINIKRFASFIAIPYLIVMFLTRVLLYCYSLHAEQIEYHSLEVLKIFSIGLYNDVAHLLYFLTLLALIVFLLPNKIIPKKKWLLNILLFGYIYLLCFDLASEFLFWEEFGSRFNFIAVDYLVYRREVVGNISESYPIGIILPALISLSLLVFYLTGKIIDQLKFRGIKNIYIIAILVTLTSFNYYFYTEEKFKFQENNFNTELSQNGIYNLFAAFINNSLDYEQFYLTLPNDEALKLLKKQLDPSGDNYLSNDIYDISRRITAQKPKHKYNIILISVESLSAEYLKYFGNKRNLTPFIDTLIPQSMVFSKYYATGTRTVRGLEAMTLSIPPTPGNSIVRRANNENLFSIGVVLERENYDNKFLYGGFGYFDNMNYFYKNNHFSTIDRSNFANEEITFSNIWGVADENLYSKALKEADKSYKENKPFFSFIMTTSNHRPFTYPDERVDIASGVSREGAVKYTDYAIKMFIESAKSKPWFKDTIFVITADHCAGSAGKSQLPLNKYHIPLIIYAPFHIKPQVINKLSSQIDLAPTLLELLGISYYSKFFGNNILSSNFKERAFIGTYQKLGFIKPKNNNYMIVLNPKRENLAYDILPSGEQKIGEVNEDILMQAIAYYQSSYLLYKMGRLNAD